MNKKIAEDTSNEKKFKKLKEKCRGGIFGSYKGVVSKKKKVRDFLSKVRNKKKFYEDEGNLCESFDEMVSEQLV